jgi:hypothetical protein
MKSRSVKKKLHKSLTHYVKKISSFTISVSKGYNPTCIHNLRTTFKKTRALLRWQKINKKVYSGFKKIYDLAGMLRNTRVTQQILAKEEYAYEGFQNWLLIQNNLDKNQWDVLNLNKILHRFEKNIENIRLNPRQNKSFFTGRAEKIKSILHLKNIPDAHLHEIRKMAKDMQYVITWRSTKTGKKKRVSKVPVTVLKKTGELAGIYNDKRSSLALLTTYVKQENDDAPVKEIMPLVSKWRQAKLIEKRKLIDTLCKIWSP